MFNGVCLEGDPKEGNWSNSEDPGGNKGTGGFACFFGEKKGLRARKERPAEEDVIKKHRTLVAYSTQEKIRLRVMSLKGKRRRGVTLTIETTGQKTEKSTNKDRFDEAVTNPKGQIRGTESYDTERKAWCGHGEKGEHRCTPQLIDAEIPRRKALKTTR